MLERDSVKQALAIGIRDRSSWPRPVRRRRDARIIDGKAVAAKLRVEYRERIAKMHACTACAPGSR
jgi:hypothetical protein